MGQVDDIRVEMTEFETSMKSDDLADTMKEIDARLMDSNVWTVPTYTAGLLTKIEYYSDAAKTIKTMQKVFTRVLGSDGISYISSITTTVYNDNGTTDSTITTTINRTSDIIVGCDSVFSTSEVLV